MPEKCDECNIIGVFSLIQGEEIAKKSFVMRQGGFFLNKKWNMGDVSSVLLPIVRWTFITNTRNMLGDDEYAFFYMFHPRDLSHGNEIIPDSLEIRLYNPKDDNGRNFQHEIFSIRINCRSKKLYVHALMKIRDSIPTFEINDDLILASCRSDGVLPIKIEKFNKFGDYAIDLLSYSSNSNRLSAVEHHITLRVMRLSGGGVAE